MILTAYIFYDRDEHEEEEPSLSDIILHSQDNFAYNWNHL